MQSQQPVNSVFGLKLLNGDLKCSECYLGDFFFWSTWGEFSFFWPLLELTTPQALQGLGNISSCISQHSHGEVLEPVLQDFTAYEYMVWIHFWLGLLPPFEALALWSGAVTPCSLPLCTFRCFKIEPEIVPLCCVFSCWSCGWEGAWALQHEMLQNRARNSSQCISSWRSRQWMELGVGLPLITANWDFHLLQFLIKWWGISSSFN